MKKNKMMRIASVLLVAVLLSTCAISGTFAKYTSTATVKATATVANWIVKIDSTEISVTGSAPTLTFELFDTACDLDGSDNVTATEDAEIKAAGQIIAPGSGGKGDFVITNNSDVKAQYKVTFASDEAGVPLEFSLDNSTWEDNISDLTPTGDLAMTDGTATVTLYWRWVFGDPANNTSDTTLGINGTATPTVTATVLVEQVD